MGINRQTLRLYWQQSRQHKVSFFIMLLAIPIGATVIDSILPYFLSQTIGDLGNGGTQVARLLIISSCVGIVGAGLNYIGFRAMVHHEGMMLTKLRETVFERIMKKDSDFFVNQKIGSMTSRYIDFVRSYVSIQDIFIIRTLGFLLTVGSGLIILAHTSLLVSAIILGLIIVLSIEIRLSAKIRKPWRHERKTLVSEIHGHVADTFTNNLIVKTYAGEAREINSLKRLTRRFTKIYKKDIGFVMTEGSLRVLLMVGVQVIAIIVSASLIKNGAMTIATAVFILAYMQRIGSQIFTLSDIINGYDQAFLDAQPMTEMLLAENSVNDAPHALSLIHI